LNEGNLTAQMDVCNLKGVKPSGLQVDEMTGISPSTLETTQKQFI